MSIKNPILLPLLLLLLLLLSTFTTSSSSNTTGGNWRLLYSSIGISAMHMQLLPTNHIITFDRTDFGPSNSTLPSCPSPNFDPNLDCTAHSVLLHLPSNSFRPLTLTTNPWCSSGSLLPNATFIQTGGFNSGERTARFFTSSSSSNTSDWVEVNGVLFTPRWYSTDQLLPDGTVIIIGGRLQFNYEFFPKQGPGKNILYPFDFLNETRDGLAENNLYPFVHLLPTGTLFVFANTRSVILDPVSNVVVKELPKIPDNIPRSYPSTGSSVLLPISLAGSDESGNVQAEVLICGGAAYGNFQAALLNGTFLQAARSCGRIRVTDPDPVWEMEDMPMPRVMSDMVLLPTGDVLVVNGAGSGTAGWELGKDPVLTPILYHPKSEPGQRFSMMSPAPTARMYHSSAVLDMHGRVIVGGSNPHMSYMFTGTAYPTELSVEAYEPEYLDERYDGLRPRVVVREGWGRVEYGEVFRVRFSVVRLRDWTGVEVVVVAPAFSTHSFGMNQRVVVLRTGIVVAIAPFYYEVEVEAPPVPEVAPPGYYLLFVVHSGVPSQGVWVRLR